MVCAWCKKEFPHKKGRFCGTCQRPKPEGQMAMEVKHDKANQQFPIVVVLHRVPLKFTVKAAIELRIKLDSAISDFQIAEAKNEH